GGIKQIAQLAPKEHRRKFLKQSNEARILLDMLKQIRAQLPADPREVLKKRIREAITAEKFEEAASLRDQLNAMVAAMAQPKTLCGKDQETAAGPGKGGLLQMPKAHKSPRKRKTKKEGGE